MGICITEETSDQLRNNNKNDTKTYIFQQNVDEDIHSSVVYTNNDNACLLTVKEIRFILW